MDEPSHMRILKRLLRWALILAFSAFLLGVLAIGVAYWLVAPRLPSVAELKDYHMQVPLRVESADGKLIATFGETRRIPVAIADVPDNLKHAVLSAEDADFYHHPGVDWRGIVRAGWHVIVTGGDKGPGGSTITQQVARNFFLSPEKLYSRKLTEIFIALRIEHELGKDQILELYLNKMFLGHRAYGVAAAASYYYGKTLDQVMDAPTYARWLVLKQKYVGDDSGIERWRPLFAAQELYKKALKANGLSNDGGVSGAVAALAKQDGVPETPVEYRVEIKQPREAIKAFKSAAPSDQECFNRTLDSIEHDLPAMTARANAWATGDLEELRRLPDSHRRDACVTAVTSAGFARQLGLDDVPAQLQAAWLAAARKSLEDYATSFAMLPMGELLSPTGYLAKLKAQGYEVEAPIGLDEAPAAAGSAAPAAAPASGP